MTFVKVSTQKVTYFHDFVIEKLRSEVSLCLGYLHTVVLNLDEAMSA